MRLVKAIVLIFVILGSSNLAFAQIDPLYNQYLFNQSMINPAYTGIGNVLSASAITRGQWIGLDGAPFTNTLNVSTSLVNNKVGVGVLVISDQFGVNNNLEAHMMYSYKLELNDEMTLMFGVQVGQMSYRHDFSKLNQNQAQSDPDLVNTDDFQKINFGTGVFLTSDNFYVGASVPRIKDIELANINGDIITRYNKHIYLSGGYVFNKGSMLAFKPSFLYKAVPGGRSALDINAHLLINETLWVGATTRSFETMGINAQINVGDQLRLGYAFEVPTSSLGTINGTTHELMVSYEFELFTNHYLEKRYW